MPAKRHCRPLCALLAACIFASAPLAAQDGLKTERAFELLGLDNEQGLTEDPERIAEGLPLLRQASDAGDAVAQNALGMVYVNGLFGVEADVEKAIALYEQACSMRPPSSSIRKTVSHTVL